MLWFFYKLSQSCSLTFSLSIPIVHKQSQFVVCYYRKPTLFNASGIIVFSLPILTIQQVITHRFLSTDRPNYFFSLEARKRETNKLKKTKISNCPFLASDKSYFRVTFKKTVLYILTIEWILRTAFAGQNICFAVFPLFCKYLYHFHVF